MSRDRNGRYGKIAQPQIRIKCNCKNVNLTTVPANNTQQNK